MEKELEMVSQQINTIAYLQDARDNLAAYIALQEIAENTVFPLNVPFLIAARITYSVYLYNLQLANAPCASTDIACFESNLNNFGVTLRAEGSANDISIGSAAYTPAAFSAAQAQMLLEAVERVAIRLAPQVSEATGQLVSIETAFQEIFAGVQFAYVPGGVGGYAITVWDSDPMVIVLPTSAFTLPGVNLDPLFLIVHELGHIFHFRHSEALSPSSEISRESQIILDYADAVGAVHTLLGSQILQPAGTNQVTANTIVYSGTEFIEQLTCSYWASPNPGSACADPNNAAQPSDLNHNIKSAPFYYYLKSNFYLLGDGGYGSYPPSPAPQPEVLFPNEYCGDPPCHPNKHPMEGFADTFAHFILNPEILPEDEVRKIYFGNNMQTWIAQILAQGT